MLQLNEPRFLRLLTELIGFGEKLQNAPGVGLIPEEALPADTVLRELGPHIASGAIEVQRMAAPGFESRPSLVLTVRGEGPRTIGFVGAHFDVVPADRVAENWEREPFKLWVGEDGTLYGRGVTDCLGHVALITDFLAQLVEQGIKPKRTVKVVLIANEEEAPLPEIGLDYVVAEGAMEDLQNGSIYWLDSADFGPTVGTGGIAMWRLEVTGVTGHSGMPHNCVNALEVGMAASLALKQWFETNYPPHPDEKRWGFLSSSSLKSTVISVVNDKITKIPGFAKIEGDIRLTPFYDLAAARAAAVAFIESLNARLASGDVPAGFPSVRTESGQVAKLKLISVGRMMEGIACDLNSEGLQVLQRAITKVRGEEAGRAFSMTGSLPLVRDLQRRGFDVQITGFGRSTYYHAPNEQAKLEHFRQGFAILREILTNAT